MEITITGIGTPQQRASARAVVAEPGGALVAPSVSRPWGSPAATADVGRLTLLSGDGTIELSGVSTASFTYGARGTGGYRYVSATFKVRNAHATDSVAYTSARTNLTFLGVNGTGAFLTLNGTAIKTLNKFDNSTSPASALAVRPTGWADLSSSATVTSHGMDVLQVYTDSEVGALTPPAGVVSVLPYGFVVRTSSSGNRDMAASPTANQFDGLLTVAYKVPLQTLATDDPYTITGVFLPVDDAETYVTQSLEDSDATATAAIAARAAGLTGSKMRSLVYSWVGTRAATFVCNARTAGTAVAPTAFLADSITVSAFSPLIGTPAGTSQSFGATFSQTMNLASASFATFVGNGTQSGRTFRTGSYSGAQTLTSPTGTFFPGEHVEIALTPKLLGSATPGSRVCPYVYRYRVSTGTASGTFVAGTPFAVDSAPFAIATGDFDGDGKLDVVAVGSGKKLATTIYTAVVLQGDGLGGFTSKGPFGVLGGTPFGVAVGDFNGDGHLDIVATTQSNGSAAIMLGDGAWNFSVTSISVAGVGDGPTGVAVGDLNGDGNLDIVTANVFVGTVSVLLGDGAGHFTQALGSPISIGANGPAAVAIGDVNNDRKMDIVTADFTTGKVSVLLNNGSARFTQPLGSPFTVGTQPFAVALGDVSGDGNLDIVTANSGSSNVTVLLGNGTGGFSAASGSPISVGTTPMGIALGDMDGDVNGRLDIVVSGSSSNDVRVLLGNGDGTFGNLTTFTFAAGTQPIGVALGSFITTGSKLGIAVANAKASNVTVLTR